MESKKTTNIPAIGFGLLAALVGAALFIGAAAVLNGNTDAQGFRMSQSEAFSVKTRAIVADAGALAEVPAGFTASVADPGTLRIRSTTATPEALFIAIASTADVERYLGEAPHHDVDVAFDETAVAVEYQANPATSVPGAPSDTDIWVAWTASDRPQTLEWDIRSGDWTAVVMNSDGSSSVDADLAFGASYDGAETLAFPAALIGALLIAGGAYGIYRGTRRPKDEEAFEGDREVSVDDKVPALLG